MPLPAAVGLPAMPFIIPTDEKGSSIGANQGVCYEPVRESRRQPRIAGRRKNFMPTRITQVDSPERAATRLKVEGSLYLADAEILERICRDIQQQSHNHITLDLSDISFLDSDSAEVLCRLKNERGVNLEGLHLFIQKVIEFVEKADEGE